MEAGAKVQHDLSLCRLIVGIKEMPASFFQPGKAYAFFSHTIKGQEYNMPMLKKLMELKCHLIDYEKIEDNTGKRLLFFGRYAGLAGMIDTLWALGQRLKTSGISNPFEEMKQAWEYASLQDAKKAVSQAGMKIKENGVPEAISPLTTGFTGYGHVSLGAQEIFDLLPFETIKPEMLIKKVSEEVISLIVRGLSPLFSIVITHRLYDFTLTLP